MDVARIARNNVLQFVQQPHQVFYIGALHSKTETTSSASKTFYCTQCWGSTTERMPSTCWEWLQDTVGIAARYSLRCDTSTRLTYFTTKAKSTTKYNYQLMAGKQIRRSDGSPEGIAVVIHLSGCRSVTLVG